MKNGCSNREYRSERKVMRIYQNCCKKCGSISLHTETKGNNTGLYCNDCGAWIKWLSKDELRAFQDSQFNHKKIIINRLQEFVDFLDSQIENQLTRESLSTEDAISKCSYAHAYEKDKNAIINIIAGRDWNDNGE